MATTPPTRLDLLTCLSPYLTMKEAAAGRIRAVASDRKAVAFDRRSVEHRAAELRKRRAVELQRMERLAQKPRRRVKSASA